MVTYTVYCQPYRLAPLPQQVIFHFSFSVHPSKLGSTSLSVVPMHGKTFKVGCTLPTHRCHRFFVYGASLFVLEALGPFQDEGPAIGYLQKGGSGQATSTSAFTLSWQGSFAATASFALAPLPVASAPLLLVRTPFLGNDFEMFHNFFAATRNGRSYSLLRVLVRKKRHSGVSGLFTRPIREQFLRPMVVASRLTSPDRSLFFGLGTA